MKTNFGVWASLILVGTPLTLKAQTDLDIDFRYIAIIEGQCLKLTVNGDDFTPSCSNKLLNIDYGNGRVSFMTFVADEWLGSFTGTQSEQTSLSSYRLLLDGFNKTFDEGEGITTAHEDVVGTCVMSGNVDREPARFTCLAENNSISIQLEFISNGKKPDVEYGHP